MEEPPIIDIEPEGSAKSRAATAIGCFIQFVPIATIGLALILGALAVALFIWGGEAREEAADALTQDAVPAAVAESPAAAAPATEASTAPSFDGPSVESAVTTTSRGDVNFMVAKGSFAGSGTQLSYEVVYQAYGEGVGYRCFLLPYDARVNRLFQANKGQLGLTFLDGTGQQLLPAQGVKLVPLAEMLAYENQGAPAGWMNRGVVPLNGVAIADIQSVKVSWQLEEELATLLQQIALEGRQ